MRFVLASHETYFEGQIIRRQGPNHILNQRPAQGGIDDQIEDVNERVWKKMCSWQFFVFFLGWLSDPFGRNSDLQLGVALSKANSSPPENRPS